MNIIERIQKDFYKNVLNKNSKTVYRHLVDKNNVKDRFSIYRNTVIENLRHALALTFPDTWKILGTACADSVARTFILKEKSLPMTGCLDDWGADFPQYLAKIETLRELPYIKDIATIEWYRHRSYCAANTKPLTMRKLKKTLQGDMEKLQFIFRPCVFLHPSNYCLQPIINLLTTPHATHTITAEAKPSFALITRNNNTIQIKWLSYELFKLLFLLHHQQPLLQAYASVLDESPHFDLTQAIDFMIEQKLIWKYKN